MKLTKSDDDGDEALNHDIAKECKFYFFTTYSRMMTFPRAFGSLLSFIFFYYQKKKNSHSSKAFRMPITASINRESNKSARRKGQKMDCGEQNLAGRFK